MRSQKRRVQRLRNRELEHAQKSGKPQIWRAKQIADKGHVGDMTPGIHKTTHGPHH